MNNMISLLIFQQNSTIHYKIRIFILTILAFLSTNIYSLKFCLENSGSTPTKFSLSSTIDDKEIILAHNKKDMLDIKISEDTKHNNIITIIMEADPNFSIPTTVISFFCKDFIKNIGDDIPKLISKFYNKTSTCRIDITQFATLDIKAVNIKFSPEETDIYLAAIQKNHFISTIRMLSIDNKNNPIYCF